MMQGMNDDPMAGLLAPLLGLPTPAAHLDAATWRTLAARAERERLAPLLYAAVQQSRRRDAPPDVLAQLAAAHCRAAAATLYQQQELAALLRHCAAAQIPCIVLKGSALAATLYPDPALRPCGDLDLLLHWDDLPTLLAVLRQRGYSMPAAADFRAAAAGAVGEYHLTRCGARPAIVEPHWRLTNSPFYARRLPMTWFWGQTMATTIGGLPAQVLAPMAQFYHLAVHFYLQHGGNQLLWLFDLALLLARAGQAWDWAAVARQARRLGVLRCIRQAIQDVQQLWPLPVAAEARNALSPLRPDLTEQIEWQLLSAPESPLWAFWRVHNDPIGRWRGLRLLVAPAPAVLARHYGLVDGVHHTRGQRWRAHWRRYRRLPLRIVQAGQECLAMMRQLAPVRRSP